MEIDNVCILGGSGFSSGITLACGKTSNREFQWKLTFRLAGTKC